MADELGGKNLAEMTRLGLQFLPASRSAQRLVGTTSRTARCPPPSLVRSTQLHELEAARERKLRRPNDPLLVSGEIRLAVFRCRG